jgi:hypothetical protein
MVAEFNTYKNQHQSLTKPAVQAKRKGKESANKEKNGQDMHA